MSKPTVKRLRDYRPPAYLVPRVDLQVDIYADRVRVRARLDVRSNGAPPGTPLELDGVGLKLKSIAVDGRPVSAERYTVTGRGLTLRDPPPEFYLDTEVEIDPYHNTALEGLYASGAILCTQNEPEGFRRITFYPDRPDVLSVFTVDITADRARFPWLLCNGNPMAAENLPEGRHRAVWHDPFPKPAYLFALVAGNLGMIEDRFVTRGGRNVTLRIFVDPGHENRAGHAMRSLKHAMRWDEEAFDREYDLDLFMIVAVDAFNFGAMENKGLNVFNSAYVLADPAAATDADYQNIEAVVAHEYFHNWSGDRVTLRDWFQITLKEGLTVFREHEFTADMTSRAVKRLDDARLIREAQFPEDAGPHAHPIQPASYIEMNNFYTATVYSKGAEVIRMVRTLAGTEAFRRAADLYFARHDGQAATTEDFIKAMEDGTGMDLAQFRRWYRQAGTPRLDVASDYDPAARVCRVTVRQSCAPTADGSPKETFHLPLAVGLLSRSGRPLPVTVADGPARIEKDTAILEVRRPEQTWTFSGVTEPPVLSLLRGFSAPARVVHPYTPEDLLLLLRADPDACARYDAGQTLALRVLLPGADAAPEWADRLLEALADLLADEALDPVFRVRLATLPTLTTLGESADVCDYPALFASREALRLRFAERYARRLRELYDRSVTDPGRVDRETMAQRALRNFCLAHLADLPGGAALAERQYRSAGNMTDSFAALCALANLDGAERDRALADFRKRWRTDFNVMNKWFGAQASSRRIRVLDDVKRLAADELFDARNPNRIRALYAAYARNLPRFHDPSGEGYDWIAARVRELDARNPHVAASLARSFEKFPRLPPAQQQRLRPLLSDLEKTPGLSPGTLEVLGKTLSAPAPA